MPLENGILIDLLHYLDDMTAKEQSMIIWNHSILDDGVIFVIQISNTISFVPFLANQHEMRLDVCYLCSH